MRSLRIIILPFLAAAVFSFAFWNGTYIQFERDRIELVFNPLAPADKTLQVPFETPANPEANILVLDFQNNAGSPLSLNISLNGTPLQPVSVPAKSSADFSVPAGPLTKGRNNTLEIRGDSNQWLLQELQITNMYGRQKSGPVRYVIAAGTATNFNSPAFYQAFVLFLILLAIGWYGKIVIPGKTGYFQAIICLVVILVAIAPLITKYRLLLSLRTFLIFLLAAYAPSIVRAYLSLVARLSTASAQRANTFKCILAATAVFAFFGFSMLEGLKFHEGNFSGFLAISARRAERNPFLQENPELLKTLKLTPGGGYDAQYFYGMAFDPFLTRFQDTPGKYSRIVDHSAFRYRRIGYSLLTKLFSGDRPEYYPVTMMLLILICYFPIGYLLARIAVLHGKSPYWALLCLLIPAFTLSLQVGLPEPIAAAFFLAGYYFYLKEKPLLSTLLFAASLMVRETTSIAILLLSAYEFLYRKRRGAAILLVSSLLPYFAWRGYVTWRLSERFGMQGFFFEPPNFTAPFAGIARLFVKMSQGAWPGIQETPAASAIVYTVILVLIGALALWTLLKKFGYPAMASFVYAILALCLSYEAVWLAMINPERQTYECLLFFLLLFLWLPSEMVKVRTAAFGLFALLFYYDWVLFSQWRYFRVGFLWGATFMS